MIAFGASLPLVGSGKPIDLGPCEGCDWVNLRTGCKPFCIFFDVTLPVGVDTAQCFRPDEDSDVEI